MQTYLGLLFHTFSSKCSQTAETEMMVICVMAVFMTSVGRTCLTLTNCIRHWGAGMYNTAVVAAGAGDTGVPQAFLVRVRALLTLLTQRVVVQLTA